MAINYLKILTLIVLSTFSTIISAQETESAPTKTLKLLFVGDIMGHGPQIKSAYDDATKTYNYSPCFQYVKPIIEQADLAIGNLEVTLPGKKPYTGYPMFRSPDALATAVKEAGFDVIVTANNHSNDGGLKGVTHTIDVLRNLKIHQTGTFKNDAEKAVYYPLMVYKNGFKLAFLNYTYDTNGVPTPKPAMVNWIEEAQIKKDIGAAKALRPDAIIVMMHWGLEYKINESPVQQDLTKKIFNWGADLVIGAHPHVVQPIKETKNAAGKKEVVAYSLGNFISNQQYKNTDGGLIFEIELQKEANKRGVTLGDSKYLPVWRYVAKKDGKATFHTLPISAVEGEDNPLSLSASNLQKMKDFATRTRKHLAKFSGKERKISWKELMSNKSPKTLGFTEQPKMRKGFLPVSYAVGNKMGNNSEIQAKGVEAKAISYYLPMPVKRTDFIVPPKDTLIKGKFEVMFEHQSKEGQTKEGQTKKAKTADKNENTAKSGERAVPKEYTFQRQKGKRTAPKKAVQQPDLMPPSKPNFTKRQPPKKPKTQQSQPQPQPSPSTSVGKYTIQFQASRNLYPKSSLPFPNVQIEETKTGWYRYYTGAAQNLDEAKLLLQQVKTAGFPDAFITKKKYIPNIEAEKENQEKGETKMYKVQFQSAQNYYNIDPKLFTDVIVVEDDRGWFRYYTGTAYSIADASTLLRAVQAKGFKDAFIVTFENGKPKN
jgi:poly-gamma-glutamate capsule biosynthesis protein CapA/YwtB (metallophosphatase superfamily)